MQVVKCLIFLFGIIFSSGQNIQTPCPEFFQYKYEQNQRQYIGLLELPPPELGQNVKLNVNLQLRVPLPSVSIVWNFSSAKYKFELIRRFSMRF